VTLGTALSSGVRAKEGEGEPSRPAVTFTRALEASIAAFDATDFDRLARFFDELRAPVDHVLVTGPSPNPGPLARSDVEEARRELDAHLLLPLMVAREATRTVRPRGTLLFLGCTDHGPPSEGYTFISALKAALSAMTKTLARRLLGERMNNVEESKSLRTTPPILSLPPTGTAPNGRKLSNAFVHVRAMYGVGGGRCSTPPKADLASGLAGSARLSGGWWARLQPMSFEGGTSLTYEGDDQEGTR
jgi:NAD(P)-dependent dehydrogenase (short-subunit alcohol dehydrogenase family)